MYQVILRSRGLEITIDSEDDLDMSLDLLEDLTSVLHLNKHSIRVAPIKEQPLAEDYRIIREVHSDTSQADTIEEALGRLGQPSTTSEIAAVAIGELGFKTRSENPQALIRQVLRKYPRFKQLSRKMWTLTAGFRQATEAAAPQKADASSSFAREKMTPG